MRARGVRAGGGRGLLAVAVLAPLGAVSLLLPSGLGVWPADSDADARDDAYAQGHAVARVEGAAPGCVEVSTRTALPPSVPESSGAAHSEWPGALLWTHNDSGHTPHLFAVAADGREVARVRVQGARNVDWEDMAAAPCPGLGSDAGLRASSVSGPVSGPESGSGSAAHPGRRCLYVGDVGDNREVRPTLALYRLPEPLPHEGAQSGDGGQRPDTLSAEAHRFEIKLPDGPRDIEALHVLEGERVFLITKGRNHPVELYALPAPLPLAPTDHPLRARLVQTLGERPPSLGRMVTGSDAWTEGRGASEWVAVRTYETLAFFRAGEDGRLVPAEGEGGDGRTPGPVNLRPLREAQGEAVAMLPDGRLVLTSEAGPGGRLGSMQLVRCGGGGDAGVGIGLSASQGQRCLRPLRGSRGPTRQSPRRWPP